MYLDRLRLGRFGVVENPFLLVKQDVRFLPVLEELFRVLDQRDLFVVELQPAVTVSDQRVVVASPRAEPLVHDHGIEFVRMTFLRRLQIPNKRLSTLSGCSDKLVDHLLLVSCDRLILAEAVDLAVVIVNDVTALLFLLKLLCQIALVKLKGEWEIHVVV